MPAIEAVEDPEIFDSSETDERHANAAKLRIAGFTDLEIAERLGYDGRGAAAWAVKQGMKVLGADLGGAERQDLINVEAARYEALIRTRYRRAFVEGDDQAMKLVLSAMAEKRKLLGLDAPSRTAVLTAGLELDANSPLTNAENVLDELMPLPVAGELGSGIIDVESTEVQPV